MKTKILLFCVCLTALDLWAQSKVTLANSRVIDPNRYEGVKGSPYIFEDWVKGDILPTAGNNIEGVELNYNGYTKNFEVRQDGRFIELYNIDFIGIRITESPSACSKMFFLKYDHPKIQNRYPLFLFNGKKYKLLKEFRITLSENKVESPGKTVRFQTFNDVVSYYLIRDQNDLEPIRLNRKSLLEKFDLPEAKTFVEEQKLDLSTEEDVCRFLTWLENRK